MDLPLIFFKIIVLVFSVVIHEVSHGFVAEHLGDPTARQAGRLTLNPLKHLDLFGSVILPLMMAILPGGVILGWAKPVPYNPQNLKNPEKGGAIIAAAGPLSNLALAIIFGLVYRLFASFTLGNNFQVLPELLNMIILVNISLAVFNLVPIPPLDGSKVLFLFLPLSARNFRNWLEQHGFIILLIFIFFGFELIIPIIIFLYRLILGF
ncbi:MAG: site-2 protease family protein [Patescibacteria group bacterium]